MVRYILFLCFVVHNKRPDDTCVRGSLRLHNFFSVDLLLGRRVSLPNSPSLPSVKLPVFCHGIYSLAPPSTQQASRFPPHVNPPAGRAQTMARHQQHGALLSLYNPRRLSPPAVVASAVAPSTPALLDHHAAVRSPPALLATLPAALLATTATTGCRRDVAAGVEARLALVAGALYNRPTITSHTSVQTFRTTFPRPLPPSLLSNSH